MIDGSKTPALVPDHVAVAALFHVLALPEGAYPRANQRFLIQTDALGLNPPDTAALRAEMTHFYYARERHRAEVDPLAKAASRDNFDERRRVEQQFDRTVIATCERPLRSLTPDGATKLRTQVDIQKSRSRLYGPPELSR